MCGGAAADIERVRPLLEVMGKAVFHLGPLGAGHAMKCLNNLVTAINFVAVTEGLAIGKRYGLDPAAMVDVLDQSTGMSWISQTHIRQRVLSRSFDDPFKLALMLKDIGIATQLARSVDVPAPLSALEPGALARRRRRCRARCERQRAGALGRAARPHRDHAGRDAARAGRVAMRVLVTGADGFIGRALVHALRVGHDVIATDRNDGDIADAAHLDRLFADGPFDRVFHLAAIVSGAAEADYDAGKRVNLDATIGLLDRCRAQAAAAGRSCASSTPARSPSSARRCRRASTTRREAKPSLSYGTHKRVAELLIDDCHAARLHRRPRAAPVGRRRPAAAGERRAVGLQQRLDPRAARRTRLRLPGRRRRDDLDRLAARRDRQPDPPRAARRRGARRAARVTAPSLAVSIADIVAALGRIDPLHRRASASSRDRRSRRSSAAGRSTARSRAPAIGLTCETSIDAVIRAHREDRMTIAREEAALRDHHRRPRPRAAPRLPARDRHGRRGHGQALRRHRQPARREHAVLDVARPAGRCGAARRRRGAARCRCRSRPSRSPTASR